MKKIIACLSNIAVVCSFSLGAVGNVFASAPREYNDMNEIVEGMESLSIPQTLGIVYPKTVSVTKGDTFYIVGTSDPEKPLYVNGEEIKERSSNGLFEVTISVPKDGFYMCTFKQDDEERKVPIFKNVEANVSYNGFALPAQIVRTNLAVDSSIFPAQNVVLDNENIQLCCSAPSGASVKANFCGVTYDLKQEKKTAELGVAAKYSVSIDLSSIIDESKTYNLGKVEYLIEFEGREEKKESVGRVYYSKKTPPYVRVSWAYGFLRQDSEDDSEVLSVLKKGVIDKVIKEEKGKYQLGCGGFIHSKFVEPIFEQTDIINRISGANFYVDDKYEKLVLKGTKNPIFTSAVIKDKLIVRLYNTEGTLDLSSLKEHSQLINDTEFKKEDRYLELNFELDSDKFWGYSIDFEGDNTEIYLKKKPKLSSNPEKPFENMTILVDAGHGGSDPGALGLLGEVGGPVEKNINLINAVAVKNRLEALGADVKMTRDRDEYVSLSERASKIEEKKADFVLVFHANASAINVLAKGLEIHYTKHNKYSLPFSSLAAKKAVEYTDLKGRSKLTVETDFYISRNTFCPTAYYECGYLTNGGDTRNLFSKEKVFALANSVADSIIEFLEDNQ